MARNWRWGSNQIVIGKGGRRKRGLRTTQTGSLVAGSPHEFDNVLEIRHLLLQDSVSFLEKLDSMSVAHGLVGRRQNPSVSGVEVPRKGPETIYPTLVHLNELKFI